jgi:hypothetical protein
MGRFEKITIESVEYMLNLCNNTTELQVLLKGVSDDSQECDLNE